MGLWQTKISEEFAANPGKRIAAEALGIWSKATNFLSNNYSVSPSELGQCPSPTLVTETPYTGFSSLMHG